MRTKEQIQAEMDEIAIYVTRLLLEMAHVDALPTIAADRPEEAAFIQANENLLALTALSCALDAPLPMMIVAGMGAPLLPLLIAHAQLQPEDFTLIAIRRILIESMFYDGRLPDDPVWETRLSDAVLMDTAWITLLDWARGVQFESLQREAVGNFRRVLWMHGCQIEHDEAVALQDAYAAAVKADETEPDNIPVNPPYDTSGQPPRLRDEWGNPLH